MYHFPAVALTKYYKLDGFNNKKLLFQEFWKPEDQGRSRVGLSEGCEEESASRLLSCFGWPVGHLWHLLAVDPSSPSLLSSSLGVLLLCMSVSTFPLLIRSRIGLGGPPYSNVNSF